MNMREKILLALMGLVALWGVYTVLTTYAFTDGQDVAPAKVAEEAQKTAEAFQPALDLTVTELETYRIAQAQKGWPADPFRAEERLERQRQAEMLETLPTDEEEQGPVYTYLGYLKIGETAYAIVNTKEYREGQTLEDGRYVVRMIEPDRITLVRASAPQDDPGLNRLVLPLERDNPFVTVTQ